MIFWHVITHGFEHVQPKKWRFKNLYILKFCVLVTQKPNSPRIEMKKYVLADFSFIIFSLCFFNLFVEKILECVFYAIENWNRRKIRNFNWAFKGGVEYIFTPCLHETIKNSRNTFTKFAYFGWKLKSTDWEDFLFINI